MCLISYLLMSVAHFSIGVFVKTQFLRDVLGINPLPIIFVANIISVLTPPLQFAYDVSIQKFQFFYS